MSDTAAKPYHIPPFFRVLIIDDEIALDYKGTEYRDFFTSYFVREVHSHGIPRENIEVKFTEDPEAGIKLWAEEVFDLTLIDCSFTHSSKVSGLDETHRFRVNAKRQGVVVLRQFHDWLNGANARFTYRKSGKYGDTFWLWTGEKEEERKETKRHLASYNLGEDYYLSKATSIKTLQECIIKRCLAIKSNTLPVGQQIERLIYAIRMSTIKASTGSPIPFSPQINPMGGVVLRVNKETALPCLNGRTDYRYAIFPKHPPKLANDDRFLPLVGGITAPHSSDGIQLSDIVQHLTQVETVEDITSVCDQYLSRQQNMALPQKAESPRYVNQKQETPPILEQTFPSRYFAAATPLTGISVIGSDRAQDALANKIVRLLNESFGGVILKTAYLDSFDQWKDANWPGIQVQSHMRTRAIYPLMTSPTLWNTGRTAMETFPPKMLNTFLKKLKSRLPDQSQRVIVSLGSKFCYSCQPSYGCQPFMEFSGAIELENLWDALFKTVFDRLDDEHYPLVEINVRHYLREIVKKHLGGDEYLNPVKLNEIGSAHADSFLAEYGEWLHVIHNVAVRYKKRLILKFPYRSDSLGLMRLAVAVRHMHVSKSNNDKDYGIRGLAVGNALKIPVPRPDRDSSVNYSPSWYANPHAWGDAANKEWKYQMSGSQLASYRNQILQGILQPDVLDTLKNLGVALFISGGITSQEDIEFVEQHMYSKDNNTQLGYGIQIGTWSLLSTGPKTEDKEDKRDWKNWKKAPKPLSPARNHNVYLTLAGCLGGCCDGKKLFEVCSNIKKPGRGPGKVATLIDPGKCTECDDRKCLSLCDKLSLKQSASNNTVSRDIKRTKENRITPRICFMSPGKCVSCGFCLQTFYCDAFSDRESTRLPPLHDSRHCTGCGLCAQICPSGALKLYRPEEKMIVLISSSIERKEVLMELGIPCLLYEPVEDLANVPVGNSNAKDSSEAVINLVTKVTNGTTNNTNELKRELQNWIKTTWKERLKEKFVLGEGKREYKDLRSDRRKECVKSAMDLSEQCSTDQPERLNAIVRAILWSQLIWSDPGQVFWDTPILVIQSCLLKAADGQPIRLGENGSYSLPSEKYFICNFVVAGQQGQLALKESMSKMFTFSGFPDWYKANELGKGRLANLDIRGYGSHLLSNYEQLSVDDIAILCGVPDMEELFWRKNGAE